MSVRIMNSASLVIVFLLDKVPVIAAMGRFDFFLSFGSNITFIIIIL